MLVDSNILLRLAEPGHPLESLARLALERLTDQGFEPRIEPQVIYEYWVVATRPISVKGLGFSVEQVQRDLVAARALFRLFRDERGILDRWEALVRDHSIHGKKAHDARLAAAMLRHGVTHLLTFNGADFQRYPHVTVLNPEEVAATA